MVGTSPNPGIPQSLNYLRLRELARKEFRQMLRDRRMLRMMFISPMIQLLVFGYAVNTDIRNVPTVVVDHDHSQASRQLQATFTASGYFRIAEAGERSAEMADALDRGRALVGLEIPVGFARELRNGGGARVQIVVDGTNSNTANLARGYASRIVQQFGANAVGTTAGRSRAPGVDFRPQIWYNPDLASRVYNVPAVMGTIVLLMCLMLTSLGVVREREMGTLEQLMVSPMHPGELILGKMLPVAIVGIIDLLLVTAVAMLWFGIPMRGSFLLLLGASMVYILAGLGLGLLISTVSNTQQEAFMTMFLVFQPAMLLSGFMFPISSMPKIFQWITLLNPIRYFLEIIRGVFLKGAGVETLWPQMVSLSLMAVVLLTLATRRFRKRIG